MKKTPFCIIVLVLLVLTGVSSAEEDTWTIKTDMPMARWFASTSVVKDKIYIIGGAADLVSTISRVDEYDTITDTWTRKADMPTARALHAAVVVNGRIYVIGGLVNPFTAISTVEEYDPATDTWTRKSDMPVAKTAPAVVLDGKIYTIGGVKGREIVLNNLVQTVEEYDPATDTWTSKAEMPTPRDYDLKLSVVNGKVYAMGGRQSWFSYVSAVEEYDPATDTWARKADTPIAGENRATTVVNGKIYTIGGWAAGRNQLSAVNEYDSATDTWTDKAHIPTPRSAVMGVSVVDGNIYVIGGLNQNQGSSFHNVDVYDPSTDTWTRKPDMPTARESMATVAINGYIYVIGGTAKLFTFAAQVLPPALPDVQVYDTGVGIRIETVAPQAGIVSGGEPITLIGKAFPPDAIVTIGGEPLSQLEVTDTVITGITPPGTEGEWDILITAPSVDFRVFAGEFFYKQGSNITVTSITPTNGGQAGGNVGRIPGSGFIPGVTVTIGGNPATNVGVITTIITFTIPPGTEGVKDVVVTNPDGQKGILQDAYTYNPFPVIGKIEPRHGGPLAGGTEITITGENFMEGVVVMIGENRVQKLDFFSPTELRLKTPPGEAGPKAVTVMNPDEQKAIKEEGFTYNPAPTITSIKPDAGSMEGGTVITITGTGFIRPGILIEGVEAGRVSYSPMEIKVRTPPSDAGVKDVVARNRDGQKATLEDAFTYNLAPVITKVIPDNGRLAGGTEIIIQGSGFLPGAKVFFSTDTGTLMTAPSAQVMSGNIITAITPLGKPGPKDIIVHNTDAQRVILTDGFTYNPLPTITHITPNNGGSSGGTKIIIQGTGFLHGVRVAVGGNAGTAQLQDENTIQVVTPSNPPGIWDVRVLNPDTQEVTAKRAFITVGEIVYNFPNPFRASQGTTFRYMTRHQVQYMTIKIFNLSGSPVDVVETTGSNEVKWHNSRVRIGLYVYLVEAELENGERRQFRSMLEVYK